MSLCVTLGEFHFSNLLDFTEEEFSALPSKNKVADEKEAGSKRQFCNIQRHGTLIMNVQVFQKYLVSILTLDKYTGQVSENTL